MQDQPPGDDDDDTTTPIDIDARRPGTPLGRAWLGLERAALRVVDRVRALRSNWEQARPDIQAALLFATADAFREWGDDAHDFARQLEDNARRRARAGVTSEP